METDELQILLDLTRAEVTARILERDEARNELALMRALGPKAHDLARQRDENASLAESLRGELEEAQAQIKALQGLELAASWERDDLRAEVKRLRERMGDMEDGLRYGEKACAALVSERDSARSQVKAWQAEELARRTERDQALADVAALREAAEAMCSTMTTDRLPDGGTRWREAHALRAALADTAAAADAYRAQVRRESLKETQAIAEKRDEARAEVERLRAERDDARAEVERLQGKVEP